MFVSQVLGDGRAVQFFSTAPAPSACRHWTFLDKNKNEIRLEWCDASFLEAVRSVYVNAYAHDGLYREFFEAPNLDAAKEILNHSWSERVAKYRQKLQKKPPEANFAVAKKGLEIIGFALFETRTRGSFPLEEVYLSPLMISPKAQGTGVGKELLFSILRQMPDLKRITLHTRKRLPAASFYKHLGFREAQAACREGAVFLEWINPSVSSAVRCA